MENQTSINAHKDNKDELIDTLNKVIYDVNLLMEKIKKLEEFKKFTEDSVFEIRNDALDLKADDNEIKKTISILSKESKLMEHELIKMGERVKKLEDKTKLL